MHSKVKNKKNKSSFFENPLSKNKGEETMLYVAKINKEALTL